jgi:uncharacterized membrane protein YphA (DoxX/SURF4 family)
MKLKDTSFFNYLSFAARIILSLTFLVSGIAKFTDISLFTWQIVSLKLFYWILVRPIAIFIPVFEIIIAIMLLTGLFDKLISVMLGMFIAALILVSVYAMEILNLENCDCFGVLIDMRYDARHLVFLSVLFLLNFLVFFDYKKKWTISNLVKIKGDNK